MSGMLIFLRLSVISGMLESLANISSLTFLVILLTFKKIVRRNLARDDHALTIKLLIWLDGVR